jgi:hypothetical protein
MTYGEFRELRVGDVVRVVKQCCTSLHCPACSVGEELTLTKEVDGQYYFEDRTGVGYNWARYFEVAQIGGDNTKLEDFL